MIDREGRNHDIGAIQPDRDIIFAASQQCRSDHADGLSSEGSKRHIGACKSATSFRGEHEKFVSCAIGDQDVPQAIAIDIAGINTHRVLKRTGQSHDGESVVGNPVRRDDDIVEHNRGGRVRRISDKIKEQCRLRACSQARNIHRDGRAVEGHSAGLRCLPIRIDVVEGRSIRSMRRHQGIAHAVEQRHFKGIRNARSGKLQG